jgi:glutamate synthase domain-containing protein 2
MAAKKASKKPARKPAAKQAKAPKTDENALLDPPDNREVLGRSKIFTPDVVNDIHMKAELGRYRMRGFSMFKKIPHWDELIFLPGTLTRFVIEGYREKCDTKTVLGARFAKKPIELDIPVYITGMSFGALSLEAKMALAKGASMAGTATCSGEGGMIPPERDLSTKWYYQVIQSRYGFNPHHLMLADAIEFFIGQGCKVGLGGHLMGQKVTEQVAEMRSLPAGIDQRSPARHPDWLGPDDLSLKVQETREATNYEVPIQLKLGAARVYDDVRMAAKCGPDIIYLDGAEGGTGAGPHTAAEETGVPLMSAIPEARRALEDVGLADEVDLVVAGGIRNGGDVAKAIALGADAVAIGHSALMALNCNKEIPGVTDYEGTIGVPAGECYHCHTGRCPVGITTQDPELRKRLDVDEAANRVYNFLHTLTLEVQMLARACGKTDVHNLEPEDLAALTTEASAMARVPLAPTTSRASARSAACRRSRRCSTSTWRTRWTSSPRRRRPGRRGRADGRDGGRSRAREDSVHRFRVPVRKALPLSGGDVRDRGHRPGGPHPREGPELAGGRRAARGGREPRGLRPLLKLLPQDLLRHPDGP